MTRIGTISILAAAFLAAAVFLLASVQASQGDPPDVNYATVVVANDNSDPENATMELTITWNDAQDCTDNYSIYLEDRGDDARQIGSNYSETDSVVYSIAHDDLTHGVGYFIYIYCGATDGGTPVTHVRIPHEWGEKTPIPGTYTSRPSLTSLSVDTGDLAPDFHRNRFSYEAPQGGNAATLTYSIDSGHQIAVISGMVRQGFGSGMVRQGFGIMGTCNVRYCTFTYRDKDGKELQTLSDADPDKDGFQVDLKGGAAYISMHVHPTIQIGRTYRLTIGDPDAMLSGLTLSGVNFGNFDPATTGYTASVANGVDETTVTPTTNDGGATYAIKLGGVTDDDGVIPLAVGSNAIAVEVTAEDGQTTQTYTVTVTRAPNSPATGAPTISGTAQVGETLTADTSGIADADGLTGATFKYQWLSSRDTDILGATGSTYTLVSADEGKTVKVRVSFTDDAGNEESLTSEPTDVVFGTTKLAATIELSPSEPVSEGTEIALSMSFANLESDSDTSDTDYIFRADVLNSENEDADGCEGGGMGLDRYMYKVDEEPEVRSGSISTSCAPGDYTVEVSISSPGNVELASATADFSVAAPPSTEATLSGLTLSGIDFGAFDPATTEYAASVANDVDETTVTPTTNDDGATYVVKLGGVEDADGTVSLSVGANVITVEVTAEDGNTVKTYTVTVTRAAPPAPGPAVTIELSPSGSVAEGTEITVTMSFANLESNSDTSDTDYIFRADVRDADACEGGGIGVERYMYKVDEDPEVRTGAISTSCAPGDYTVEVSISSSGNVELASTTADFTVNGPTQQQQDQEPPPSTDAALNSLALSNVILAFASTMTEYAATVSNDVTETTVTPTLSDDGATYAVKLGGVADADGVIPLAVGSNVIAIEVTAEDGTTARTYTVTVTRAAPTLSTDATLSGLTLSGVDFGTFDPATTAYTASVANDVEETTVTPAVNHDGAAYAVKLDGAVDEDGVVLLAEGENAITIEVTAEDGETMITYEVAVTRAGPPATGPTATIDLSPSGPVTEGTEITVTMSFANLEFDSDTSDTDYIFRADVVDADECENQAGGYGLGVERYMYRVDEDPEIRAGTISAACAPGEYTIEASISAPDGVELASASATFSVVEPAPPLSTDATLRSLTLSGVTLAFDPATTAYTAGVENEVSETTVTPAVNHDGAAYVVKLDGVVDEDGVVPLAEGENAITIEVTAEDGETMIAYEVAVTRAGPPATGPTATIDLSPSGPVVEGTEITVTMSFANLEFDSDTSTTDYIFRADVVDADGCENQAGGYGLGVERYMYQVDEDPEVRAGTVSAACPAGDYTIEASIASPGNVELASASASFSVVEPEPPLSTDATLHSLALSGMDFGVFDPATTGYTADVANGVDETTVTPAANHDGATYTIKLDGVVDDDGTVPLAVGENVIAIEVTAEDGETIITYEVAVTRAEPLSNDATLSGLTLSGVTLAFDPAATGYTASVANDVTETTVTPATNHDGAAYAIKLDGVVDEDGVILLAVGGNVITIEVTAEDGETTRTYTVTVTRAEAPPEPEATATVDLSPSGPVTEGTEITVTMTFTGLTLDSEANLVFRADVVDADACEGEGIGVDRNMSKVDEDPETRTGTIATACPAGDYTLEVSISSSDDVELASANASFSVVEPEPPLSTDATLSNLGLSDVNLGTFDPASTDYTADVANDVSETTVTPTVNHDGATYVVQLDGQVDADGTVALVVGDNAVSVVVTAEDGHTTHTYTVTVTRAEPLSTDATLSGLTLSDVTLAFDPATTDYTAEVANDVAETTVTPTPNHDGATYAVKLDGAVVEDGVVPLAEGENTITIEVTAEDGNASKTYTVTVTRAEAPAPPEPEPSSPPDVPDTPTGEVTGKGRVTLDWNDVAGAAYYQVRFWKATEWVELPTDDIGIALDGSGATVSNLPDYGFYYFAVRAGNAAGLSDWSEFVTLAVPDW